MKLIVIRGNSGSGKSTLALSLRDELVQKGIKTAIISQDYFRRTVLKEKDRIDQLDVIRLLDVNVRCLIDMGYLVILEGILSKKKYASFMLKLNQNLGHDNVQFYYYNVSFEESLKRHTNKPN